MRTTILAYVIPFAGLGLSIGSLAVLVSERAVPLRHYAAGIAMISGGLGLGGLVRALRLAEILTRGAWFI
jgi:hypothetical protein